MRDNPTHAQVESFLWQDGSHNAFTYLHCRRQKRQKVYTLTLKSCRNNERLQIWMLVDRIPIPLVNKRTLLSHCFEKLSRLSLNRLPCMATVHMSISLFMLSICLPSRQYKVKYTPDTVHNGSFATVSTADAAISTPSTLSIPFVHFSSVCFINTRLWIASQCFEPRLV